MTTCRNLAIQCLACLCLTVALSGCSCEDSEATPAANNGVVPDTGNNGEPDSGNNGEPDTGNNGEPDAGNNGQMTHYERLGGQQGVISFVANFASRLLEDPKINAYFLNGATDIDRVVECLVLQVTVATGGPGEYPDAEGRCRSMAESHAGLGISQQDYDDLLGHFVEAAKDAEVPDDILDDLSAIFTDESFVADIVEDADNTGTLYQRVGRKPQVDLIVEDFLGRVLLDPKINAYFLNDSLDSERLAYCLERQVCQLAGGPCVYGDERVDPDQPAAAPYDTVCRNMVDAHAGLGISAQDYDDLLGHLAAAALEGGVAEEDLGAIAAVLTDEAFAGDIIEDPNNDGSAYQVLGRKPGIDAVMADFYERVLANPQINGFFSEASENRVVTCLIRQVCEVSGGPCKYGEGVERDLMIDGEVVPCRSMVDAHADATNPPATDDAPGITVEDFAALVANLVEALMDAVVPQDLIETLVATLDPLCAEIVADPETCNAD